jgi:hypothetical protein
MLEKYIEKLALVVPEHVTIYCAMTAWSVAR